MGTTPFLLKPLRFPSQPLTQYFFCGIILLQQKKRELTPLSEADR